MAERLTAVVCDDAPGFRTLLSALLAEAGFDVTGRGGTWEEAERMAGSVDAVVVDLWMPDLDVEALSRVRAAAPEATLAVVTALDLDDARTRIGERGVDLLLSKLAPPVEVAQAIAAHAHSRPPAGDVDRMEDVR